MKKFEYLTVPVALAREAFAHNLEHIQPVSQRKRAEQMEEILQQGYRWVRTDNDYAIFEREIAVKKPDPFRLLKETMKIETTEWP